MLIVQRATLDISIESSVLRYVEQGWSMSGNRHMVGLGCCGLNVARVVYFGSRANQAKRGAVVHPLDPQLAGGRLGARLQGTVLGQADRIVHRCCECVVVLYYCTFIFWRSCLSCVLFRS